MNLQNDMNKVYLKLKQTQKKKQKQLQQNFLKSKQNIPGKLLQLLPKYTLDTFNKFTIWASVKGFEDIYEVSTCGMIRNKQFGKILRHRYDDNGYPRVNLLDSDGNQKTFRIHQLVLPAFEPNIFNKPCIDHIDNNPKNNNISNLRYATHQENIFNTKISKINKTGAKGVQLCLNNKYRARIKINGKEMNLGTYRTFEQARTARATAAELLFGTYKHTSERLELNEQQFQKQYIQTSEKLKQTLKQRRLVKENFTFDKPSPACSDIFEWFSTIYQPSNDKTTAPIKVMVLFEEFQNSSLFNNLTNNDRRKYTKKYFTEQLQNNPSLSKFVKPRDTTYNKVRYRVPYITGFQIVETKG
jgi:hypothetical protein